VQKEKLKSWTLRRRGYGMFFRSVVIVWGIAGAEEIFGDGWGWSMCCISPSISVSSSISIWTSTATSTPTLVLKEKMREISSPRS
jgi:hypothetical protein